MQLLRLDAKAKAVCLVWLAGSLSTRALCAETSTQMLPALPQPKATAQELAQPCQTVRFNDDDGFQDEAARSALRDAEAEKAKRAGAQAATTQSLKKWRDVYFASTLYGTTLNWGRAHFGKRYFEANACQDSRFLIAQWQRSVGHPETGRWTAEDVRDFVSNWLPRQEQAAAASREAERQRYDTLSEQGKCDMSFHKTCDADLLAEFRRQTQLYEECKQASGHTCNLAQRDAFEQKKQQNNGAVARTDRSGISIFGFELGTPPGISECYDIFGRNTNHSTCFVRRSGSLEIYFANAEVPGVLAKNVRLRLLKGLIEGVGFSVKYGMLNAFVGQMDQKLGKHNVEDVPLVNNRGASWNGARYQWTAEDVRASINCLEFAPTACDVRVVTNVLIATENQSRQKEVGQGRPL